VRSIVSAFLPDEIYFLAAFHHASESLPLNEYDLVSRSFEVNTLALHNFLNAIVHEIPHPRLFYAASSHIFGEPPENLQNEETPLNPSCIYGISKAAGVRLCRYYRCRHDIFASVGILYNHESPRRAPTFVLRKVVKAAVAISKNRQDKLMLGNLDACVDWGYAPDYVDAMWRILQLDNPADFVVSSGELHSVREAVEIAFETVGLDWRAYVEVDPAIPRKSYSGSLRGDSSKLRSLTGWCPSKPFHAMVEEIVKIEIENE
jgi:GDPmannose 4,6-dehydratase